MPEWDRFKFEIGKGSSNELTTVRHIAHVPFARRIIQDGQIKAGLIYDKSVLNTSRTSVTWVSANTWGPGSIYGTVEFQFTWADLVADQKIYWVEEMLDYHPIAYRLLLSQRDNVPDLKSYDPIKDEGPLRLKDGKYHWNGEYTSEFMIESDLLLCRCTGVDFVMHHERYCRPFGAACDDRKKQPRPQRTGGKILSFLLANRLHVLDKHLNPAGAEQIFTGLDTGFEGLLHFMPAQVTFGGPISADTECQDVLRGALALYGADRQDQARRLLALIISKDKFIGALKQLVREHFADPKWDQKF